MTLLVLISAVLGAFFLAWGIGKFPILGLAIVGMVALIEWNVPYLPMLFSVGSIQIGCTDAIAGVLVLSLFFRLDIRRFRSVTASAILAATFLLLLAASVVLGAREFGMSGSLNEARPWIYIVCCFCWTMNSLSKREVEKAQILIILLGCAISVVWLFHLAQYGFGSTSTYVGTREIAGDDVSVGRLTTSGQTIIISIAAILALDRYRAKRRAMWVVYSALLTGVVVLAQHRSVWVAAFAMFVAYAILNLRRLIPLAVFTTLGVTIVAILAIAGSLGELGRSISESSSDSRTLDGRVFDWFVSLRELVNAGLVETFFGWPFGRGYERMREDGLIIDYVPHSWYVGATLRLGLSGLITGLLWMASHLRRQSYIANNVRVPIFLGLGLYCVFYNLQWYLTPIIAIMLIGPRVLGSRPTDLSERAMHESE
ncbi:hypothetical protein [Arthrobacter sp. AOP36-C1-22]|uniref:hypothetical protein n=1 Tax=Arthrobacter sp. AOP36-C1-22 TaxID=3457683 RepID=UPI0040342408